MSIKKTLEESKSTGCTKCGCQSNIAHYDGCTELGAALCLKTDEHLIVFQKDGKKSYFDYNDGKWQFWGDMLIDESAKLLFERLSGYISNHTKYEIEKALNEVTPEEIYVPEECSSDEKTLAKIAFDRGHNQCLKQIKSNISNYIK